jgi:hypothetical protein
MLTQYPELANSVASQNAAPKDIGRGREMLIPALGSVKRGRA